MRRARRVAVLSNTLSQRNRRGIDGVERLLAGRADVAHRHVCGIAGLDDALRGALDDGVEALALNGGDGFVQASLTALHQMGADPPVALLPGGMTNLVAYDVCRSTRREAALKGLLRMIDAQRLETRTRATIKLTRDAATPPVLGLFFGGASITRAIMFTRREIHTKGFESASASAAALGALVLRRAFRAGAGTHDAVVRGDRIEMAIDDAGPRESDLSLVLATTLERLILRSRPFWGDGDGALKHTEVSHPAPSLCRVAPVMLWGGESRDLPKDRFFSGRARRIAYRMTAPYTLDGEIFAPNGDAPVVLEEGPEFRFVCC